ncbi:unnamed protein product [Nyctereutes procyonoides]|uniref:(raccoon dog) hypothetical protein n=1 Tax=Nyctereutes procyonoides TaxID=34880 RepID=A0A811Z6S2_NYCPR|nr:unnamed protein product [Nyctereutes procyonoides]
MSPHGKRAGSQAQGQPRPPPSTPRAPDRRACAPRALAPRSSAAGDGPRAGPPAPPRALPGVPRPPPASAGPARRGPGRGAPRALPPRPPPGRLPSGCNVTQLRRRRLPCSSTGRDASRGRSSGHGAAACESLPAAPVGRGPRGGTRCARRGGPPPSLPGTRAAPLAVRTRRGGRSEARKNCLPITLKS